MTNPLIVLANAAAAWAGRPISSSLEWDVRRALLDWFAATLPGCVEGPSVALAKALGSGRGQGAAVCYVDGGRGDARHAAFLNGTASHTTEFDDIFRDGGYHPGSPTIAAALAVAQQQGASLEQFQRALIAGYEVGCRIALALQPGHYRNWHITSTVGTVGAAVSTAMLHDCSAEQIAHAMAIATSFAGGHQENLQGKGEAKALHCGHAAEAGVLAGRAAAAGVTGSLASLDAANGFAAATGDGTGNWELAFQGLGEWTPISRMTIKNHGCCGHIFPTLDGLNALRAEHGFGPADIERIDVRGYRATVTICDRLEVETARDARFSLQYCVSALLHLGRVRLAAFNSDALSRSDIRALMPSIRVAEDAEIAEAYPGRRMAKLAVVLKDGRTLERFQRTRKGDPDNPLTDAELFDKFDELASEALEPEDSQELKSMITRQSHLPGAVALRGSVAPQA